jgi:cytochrome c oxidase subunit 3
MGIEAVNAFELPLLNTVLLLASGVTITLAHHGVISGDRNLSLFGILATLFLAAIFTTFQGIEYAVSSFTISDGTYGSVFYFATGFHGFHVIIGTIFIGVGL